MTSEKKHDAGFEQDLEKLESVVAALEEGGLPLDKALKQFETGIQLARKCEKALREAEQKIEILVRGLDGEMEAQPFSEENGAGRDETRTASGFIAPARAKKGKTDTGTKDDYYDEPPFEEEASSFDSDDDGDELF